MRSIALRCILTTGLVVGFGVTAPAQKPHNNNPSDTKSAKGFDVEPMLSAKKGQFRAVLVGVNDYERLKDLRFCEEDVRGLRDQLIKMGFRRDTIKCLTTGDSDPAYRPSYRNISERLDAVFSGLDESSVLIIALSGHGGSFEFRDRSGKESKASFYCPQDARLYDPQGTMISVKSIYKRLERCPARFKMLLVDACRDPHIVPLGARTAIDESKSMADFSKSFSDSRLPRGTLALVSCASGEQSYEDPALKHGIFMYYLLEGLAGRADAAYRGNRNGMVSYRELKDYVYRKTSDHAWQKYDQPQTPEFLANVWELPDFDLLPSQSFLVTLTFPAAESFQNQATVTAVAFSPNGQYFVLGTETGYVAIWDMIAGAFQRAIPGHKKAVKLISFGKSDRHMLTGADDLSVAFWDLDSNKRLLTYQGAPLTALYDIRLSPNDDYALSRGFDGFGKIWNLSSNREVGSLFSYGFSFGPNGTRFVTTPRRRPGAQIVRTSDGEVLGTVANDSKASVHAVAFDPTGHVFATIQDTYGSEDATGLILWNAQTFGRLRRVYLQSNSALADSENKMHNLPVCLAFSPNGEQLLIGCHDGRILLADVKTGNVEKTFSLSQNFSVRKVEFLGSPFPSHVSAVGVDWNQEQEKQITALWRIDGHSPEWELPDVTVVGSEGLLAASITSEKDVRFFDASTPKRYVHLRGFENGKKWSIVGRGD